VSHDTGEEPSVDEEAEDLVSNVSVLEMNELQKLKVQGCFV